MSLDDKYEFELLRDVAEHNAMFSNPDGVQQVRNSRENTYEMSDKDFDSILEDQFGRKLNDQNKETFVPNTGKGKAVKADINTYLNMDLDEIKFTPYDS